MMQSNLGNQSVVHLYSMIAFAKAKMGLSTGDIVVLVLAKGK